MKDYVVTFHSFSKTYAMAGFRIGYTSGPEKLIKAMDKTSHYITLCPPHISQLLAIKALSIPKKYVEAMRLEYDRRRKFIVRRLNEIGFKTNMPNGAFYTFSNIKEYHKNSLKFSQLLLKKAKVAVVPGTEFGRYGEGYIRCSYATSLPSIRKAMDRLEKFMKRYKKWKKIAVVALGGNALTRRGEKGSYKELTNNIKKSIKFLVPIFKKYKTVIVSGSGPQIGAIILQNEIAKNKVPPMPIDVLDAELEGELGYLIEQSLMNNLNKHKLKIPVVTMLNQVLVDKKDKAFKHPS